MNKTDLKKYIARTAYNVGFGAKKNYASYDIVRNANEYISIISMIIGVLALVSESLKGKIISASLLIAGIVGLYINKFDAATFELKYKPNDILLNFLEKNKGQYYTNNMILEKLNDLGCIISQYTLGITLKNLGYIKKRKRMSGISAIVYKL